MISKAYFSNLKNRLALLSSMIYRYFPLKPLTSMEQSMGLELLGNSTYKCDDGITWIFNIFGDCVDTFTKLAGFIIGLVSLVMWLLPLFPQLYENYVTKRCDGLSIFFLIFWMIGDSCNMIGAILTHQQPLQQIIGVYYIMQDMMLFSQYLYYTRVYRSTRQGLMTGPSIVVPVFLFGMFGVTSLMPASSSTTLSRQYVLQPGGRRLLVSNESMNGFPIFDDYKHGLGYVIGCLAALCYFSGRIPQLMRNYYRKSCDGLSVAMFYIIVVANFTYGLSVILESTGGDYIENHLPWLVGSMGCCVFDGIVILQYHYYTRKNAASAFKDENEGLLMREDDDGGSGVNDNDSDDDSRGNRNVEAGRVATRHI